MVEEDKYCIDVLTQVAAATKALQAFSLELLDEHLATCVVQHERAETYPDGLFARLGEAGLLGLPYAEELGGGGQPYEVYLQ
ncbi:metal-sensing transcriptional repressor, partial [Pseudonocardia xinjiangensis]|nr:metal-sensing transcriptional repressor [Pseudonocardia xinjiangensis]